MANIEKHLPPRFSRIEEFMEFCLAENPEFDEMEEIREKWLKNKFPAEADLDGIKIFEKILDIKPGENETLEDRRFRVLTKLNQRLPYTWIQLRRMLAALCGWDGYEIELEDFILTVYLSMDSQDKIRAVIDLLADVLPMHILIKIIQAINWVTKQKLYAYPEVEVDIGIVPFQEISKTFNLLEKAIVLPQFLVEIDIKPQIEN